MIIEGPLAGPISIYRRNSHQLNVTLIGWLSEKKYAKELLLGRYFVLVYFVV